MIVRKQLLYDALDMISKGITRPTKISALIGVTYRTFCNWMVRSNAGDPKFLIEYNGEEVQFAKAIALSTKLALLELRGMLLQEGIYGFDEVQVFQGQTVWQLDPAAMAISDLELRELLYGRSDGLLVRDGKLVPLTVKRKAPFAQQIRLLEAAFADLRPSSTVTQNLNVNGQVGVGVGFAPRTDYSRPPTIPPPPTMPVIAPPITDAVFSEVVADAPDDDFAGILGDPPTPAAVEISVAVVAEPEQDTVRDEPPVAVETSPPPRAFDEPPERPANTPLMQSLYDALEQAKARKAAS